MGNLKSWILSLGHPIYVYLYHSHFGKVDKSRLGEVCRALLNVGEVREIDAEVGDTGWVTPTILCVTDMAPMELTLFAYWI